MLLQSNLRKQIRNLPKILNFVKIIHYFSKLFTGVLIHYDRRLGKSRWPPSRCTFSSPAQVGKTIVARYYNESCEEVLMQEPARSDAPVLAASSARCSLAIVAPAVQLWRFVLGRQEHTKTGSRRWKKERRMRCQKSIRKLIASGPMSKDAMKLHEQHWT